MDGLKALMEAIKSNPFLTCVAIIFLCCSTINKNPEYADQLFPPSISQKVKDICGFVSVVTLAFAFYTHGNTALSRKNIKEGLKEIRKDEAKEIEKGNDIEFKGETAITPTPKKRTKTVAKKITKKKTPKKNIA